MECSRKDMHFSYKKKVLKKTDECNRCIKSEKDDKQKSQTSELCKGNSKVH